MVEEAVVEEVVEATEEMDDATNMLTAMDDEAQEVVEAVEEAAEEAMEEEEAEGCMPTVTECCCQKKEWEDLVNIPDFIYVDGRVDEEARQLVEQLDPLVLDLTFDDLDLTPEQLENLDEDVLVPAMRAAIDQAIAEDPSLADGLPDLPTQFDKVVDAVAKIVSEEDVGMEFPDIEGATHTLYDSNGYIETWEDYDMAVMFQELTPTVWWYIDDACEAAGTCNIGSARNDQWKDLQRKAIGTAFYKLDLDAIDIMGAPPAPWFTVQLGDKVYYDGDLSETTWYDFEAIVTQLNKETIETANATVDVSRSAEGVFDMSTDGQVNLKDLSDEELEQIVEDMK